MRGRIIKAFQSVLGRAAGDFMRSQINSRELQEDFGGVSRRFSWLNPPLTLIFDPNCTSASCCKRKAKKVSKGLESFRRISRGLREIYGCCRGNIGSCTTLNVTGGFKKLQTLTFRGVARRIDGFWFQVSKRNSG